MAKEVVGFINLQIPAGKASPAPPVGPALSQRGLNIMDFCKLFNAKTADMKPGMPIPVVITAYKDRTFDMVMKKPPVSYFLKEAAGLQKGASTAGRAAAVGKVTEADVLEIAKQKMEDMNAHTEEAACQMIRGSARSMGIDVVVAGA